MRISDWSSDVCSSDLKDFPAAADPTVGPMIQSVFNQALKNTKGDRTKAVAQTKKMISLMARRTGGDLNLNVAPRGPNAVPPTRSEARRVGKEYVRKCGSRGSL